MENKDADKQKQNRNCQKNTYTHNIGLMKIKTYSGFFSAMISNPVQHCTNFSQTEKKQQIVLSQNSQQAINHVEEPANRQINPSRTKKQIQHEKQQLTGFTSPLPFFSPQLPPSSLLIISINPSIILTQSHAVNPPEASPLLQSFSTKHDTRESDSARRCCVSIF